VIILNDYMEENKLEPRGAERLYVYQPRRMLVKGLSNPAYQIIHSSHAVRLHSEICILQAPAIWSKLPCINKLTQKSWKMHTIRYP
jgi:hypothetical protein